MDDKSKEVLVNILANMKPTWDGMSISVNAIDVLFEIKLRPNGVANTDFNLTQPTASQVKS